MDLQKAKILLEKIEALHHSMSMDPINVDAIEKDLMKSYIRQLYEVYLEEKTITSRPKVKRSQVEVIKAAPKKAAPAPAPKVEATPPPPPPAPEPPKPTYKPPRIIQIPDSLKEEVAPPPPPPPAPKVEVVKEKPAPAPVVEEVPAPPPAPTPPPPAPKKSKVKVPANMGDLFDGEAESKDLSDRLSATPIKDIKRAMSINEKVLTLNELFEGNNRDFEKTLDTLNGVGSYDEAKAYLAEHVVVKYNWVDAAKVKKAKKFLKLVKRRYT